MAPPVDSATHCERDDVAKNCGIEITSAMIEAGAREIEEYDDRFESSESAVCRIYRAMVMVYRLRVD
jgi:hypothetical protein